MGQGSRKTLLFKVTVMYSLLKLLLVPTPTYLPQIFQNFWHYFPSIFSYIKFSHTWFNYFEFYLVIYLCGLKKNPLGNHGNTEMERDQGGWREDWFGWIWEKTWDGRETEHHSHPMLGKLLTMANGNISRWLGPWVCHPWMTWCHDPHFPWQECS